MKTEEILENEDNLVKYLLQQGYSLNSKYKDVDYPDAKFINISNSDLMAIEVCRDLTEVRTSKNHFLIDRGLTHCAVIINQKVLFYRNYGDIRYFAYSKRTEFSPSKIDKLRRIGENIDILFQLKDVSNDFYETFKRERNILVRAIQGGMKDVQKYLVAQKIFDRIFFIYFLCHKELVRFQDGRIVSGKTLFRIMLENGDFLENLYRVFTAFNSESPQRINFGTHSLQFPFLNGGLFRPGPEETGLRVGLRHSQWEEIFEFLDSYHWIIEDDIEEGEHERILTPEILGHVYERSVVEWEKKGFQEEVAEASGKTERRSKGVYYTPEAITDFICRKTMYSALLSKLGNEYDDVNELIRTGRPEDCELALKVLDSITILDPACGSGAFLIKAADTLFQLKSRMLSRLGRRPDHYRIKMSVITRNIYGVDILEGATEIAKLRLWLWLVSSFSESEEVTPLPNIEYNIVVGNSVVGWTKEKFAAILDIPLSSEIGRTLEGLIARDKQSSENLKSARELLKSYELNNYVVAYELLYNEYKNAHGDIASTLKSILTEIRVLVYQTIDQAFLNHVNHNSGKSRTTTIAKLNTGTFHWGYDFGKILGNGGFDVVIGNPPYISNWTLSRTNRDQVEFLDRKFSEITIGHWDLYIMFIMQSLFLLKPGGYLSFIVPSSFSKEKYGRKLRELIVKRYMLTALVDFGTEDVFEDVARQYEIFVVRNESNPKNVTKILKYGNGIFRDSGSIDQTEFLTFHNCTFRTDLGPADLSIMKRASRNTIPLGNICCINPGVVAHSREGSPIEFTKDDVVHDSFSKGYKKYLEGKDISRYNIRWGGRYMDYDSKIQYFHRPKFPQLFERNKIIVRRISGENNRLVMVYDEDQYYTNDNLLHLILWDEEVIKMQNPGKLKIHKPYKEFSLQYLTGIIGSVLISYIFSKFLATGTLQGTYSGVYPEDLRNIPVVIAQKSRRDELARLVERMVSLNKDFNRSESADARRRLELEIGATDNEIDQLVYRIYGINEEEKTVIERTVLAKPSVGN